MAVVKHSVAVAAVTVAEVAAVVVGDPVRDRVNRGDSNIREEGSWRRRKNGASWSVFVMDSDPS